MAFHDSPIVDKNAERSEHSVLSTRQFFSKKNGFISREVTSDDYGVDIYAELIVKEAATGNVFPIQIKSTSKSRYAFNQGKFYTLPFSTSRLGYLYRHNAFFSSIIIFYDESTDSIFYDFVTEILNRVLLGKNDEKWMQQKTVTISFPEDNLIDNSSIRIIHRIISKRFGEVRNALKNIIFDLVLLRERQIENNDSKLQKIVIFLKQFGSDLFNERKYFDLINLIEQLPKKELDHPRIAYLAALVYTESSEVLSADYFIKICLNSFSHFNEKGKEAILMQKYKNDYQLGLYTSDEFLKQLNDLKQKIKSPENIINIEININQLEINKAIESKDFEVDLEGKTYEFYLNILKLDIEQEQKYFQILFQTENLLHSIIGKFSLYLVNRKLYNESHEKFIQKNELNFIRFTNIIEEINKNLENAHNYAKDNNNELMLSHYYYYKALSAFMIHLNYYIFDYIPDNVEVIKNSLKEIYSNFIKAFNLYKSFNLKHQVFLSISNACETHLMSKYWINDDIVDEETFIGLEKERKSFSNEVYYNRYSSIVSKTANDKIKNVSIELDEKKLELMAKMAIEMEQLPEDRLENIKNELSAIDLFNKICKNEELELLTNQANPNLGHERYKIPSKFAIRSKATGILYGEGYDIKLILSKLGYEI